MPELKHVVSFSGGIGSFWTAMRVVERHGTDGVCLLFADTMIEDEDLYRFIADAEKVIGVQITTIKDGREPWDVFDDNKMIANSRADICSRVLKREILWKWIDDHAPNAVVYLGIDWTESHRIERVKSIRSEYQIEAPMCEAPMWSKDRMKVELFNLGIEIPRLYKMGYPHNNCGGFCVKAGQAQFALLLRTMPERYAHHEAKEEAFRAKYNKDVSIMKDRRGGVTKPFTMKRFREQIQKEPELFDKHEWGGCGCAID